ncbi:Pentatricopeptide repeat-containing protein, putative isoform 3 [Hibiscus syriacus]|uniref:Pentatricopeptide repeat-containing protein, putative isoform 3 n=1 Tax=Hibiscus syriacus TaxID=106335 RepID=A0A6A3CAX9_HIBSY|nr:Pentatricopeptide repeat-containing protein, putative isoform 3 [Hibiscus syriacus]
MKVSSSIFSKLLFIAKKPFRQIPSNNLSSCSSCLLESQHFSTQPSEECNNPMSRIKSILSKRGFDINPENLHAVDLNESSLIRILTHLFHESSNAELALHFFKLSEHCIGSLQSHKSVCKMIHILVSGNMNHVAVDFILNLVRDSVSKEVSVDVLLKLVYETHSHRMVFQTVCSMLLHCCIRENKVDPAFELTCQMKSFDMFPSVGVCHSLLRALLGLNMAWDFLDRMMRQGIHLNVSIATLFVDMFCR